MRITDTIDHPASPERVFAMLCSEEFQNRTCARSGAQEHEATVVEHGSGVRITTRRRMPTDDFPDLVKGMVGATVVILGVQNWGAAGPDGSRQATLTVEVEGTPVTLTGTVSLAPGGAGTIETVEGELTARVPLFAGKVEKAAAPAFLAGIRVEGRVAREWLAPT